MTPSPVTLRPMTEREQELYLSSFLLTGATKEELIAACRAVLPRAADYPAGGLVVRAGESFSAIGILASGTLRISREGERRRVLHRTLTAGDTFGVSTLFGSGGGFPTTVEAVTDVTVLLLDEGELSAIFAASPTSVRNYITLLSQKIRFLNERLDSLAGRSAEERVAAYLLSHADGSNLGITKSALASMLGLGRASLYRILDVFEERGLIVAHRDRIELPDTEALKKFVKTRKEY